jgi:MyTH4 domain
VEGQDEVAQLRWILDKALRNVQLRAEVYSQIIKQTVDNPNAFVPSLFYFLFLLLLLLLLLFFVLFCFFLFVILVIPFCNFFNIYIYFFSGATDRAVLLLNQLYVLITPSSSLILLTLLRCATCIPNNAETFRAVNSFLFTVATTLATAARNSLYQLAPFVARESIPSIIEYVFFSFLVYSPYIIFVIIYATFPFFK